MIVDASRDTATIAGSIPPDQLLDVIGVDSATPIVDVTHDSRQVQPGWAFACVVGDHFDGHDFAGVAAAWSDRYGRQPHPFAAVQVPGPLPPSAATVVGDFWIYAPSPA